MGFADSRNAGPSKKTRNPSDELQGDPLAVLIPFAQFMTVCAGWGLSELKTHCVRFDYFHGMRLALSHAGPVFENKIAALWSGSTDRRANGMAKAGFAVHHPGGMSLAEKLFFDYDSLDIRRAVNALRRHQVRSLLVGSGITVPDEIAAIVPQEGWVTYRSPDVKGGFGWVDTQNKLIGIWGVEMLAAKLL